MVKKLFLLFMLIFNIFLLIQNTVSAEEQYKTDFLINAIQKKVERNWLRPLKATNNISAIVSFNVNPDGSVSPVYIIRSSEDLDFDKSAIEAVYKAAPFEYSSTMNEPISMEIFFSTSFLFASELKNNNLDNNIVNVSNRSNYTDNYIDFSDYLQNLQTKVNANWQPKAFAKKRENIRLIKIDKDGALGKVSMLKPSHDFRFDISTWDAIAKTVPMDAFPSEITAPTTNIQLNFHYEKDLLENGQKTSIHFVTASVMNVEGYDKYTDMVEKIFENNIKNIGTFYGKSLIFEVQINRVGKLKYIKIIKPSKSKWLDRVALYTLNKSSFPQFPDTIKSDSITLRYELITGIPTGTRIFPKFDDDQ